MFRRLPSFVAVPIVVVVVMTLGGCGGDGDDQGEVEATLSSTATEQSVSSTTTMGSTGPSSSEVDAGQTSRTGSDGDTTGGDGEVLPEEIDRVDWLTVAGGLTLVSFEGEGASASNAVRMIDGEPTQIGYGNAADGPVTYVFELPAATTFDRFAVPDTRNTPGNTTFAGAIEVAGSADSPTAGFELLVAEEFDELPADQEAVEYEPSFDGPVRFLRVTLSGGLQVEPDHGTGRTTVRFSELIGNGTQEPVPLATGFGGVWELAFADNPDGAGELTELHQEGARVTGCVGFAEVSGNVTGNVVRLNGVDTRDERLSAYLFVVDADRRLRGMESTRGGVFRARLGRVAADGTTTGCSDTAPEPLACGAIAYVNFDLDSAEIRPDSAQILDDLFHGVSGIEESPVTVAGHTSTEGTVDYNQDLSERRARSVVGALIERGLSPDRVVAAGKGESEPLVSESDEASRAINRRVEIICP